MSSTNSIVINCGASHVAVAAMSTNNGKLQLDEFAARELIYDRAQDDAWLPAILRSLGEIKSTHPTLSGKARIILPGYMLFTKPIKVPHVEKAKQAQIISFEAQNNMPFPLKEVVWGSQTIADDGIETEVILVALKVDQANRFCNQVAMIGFEPTSLQPASLLDYNAYRLVHGEQEEDTLMVNIGARSTNLTFTSADGFFVRNLSLGGNTFTQMVAESTAKSFDEAEQTKVAFYSGQSSFGADDPAVAPMQMKAQDFMRKLSQEITRSIVTYKRSSNRPAPARIMLTGRGALLSGLSEFLCDAQKVSVDYFNPITVMGLGAKVSRDTADQIYYQISELVGEAARPILKDPVGVDLVPGAIRARVLFEKKKPILVAAAACLALSPVPMLAKSIYQMHLVNGQNKELQSRIGQLQGMENTIQDLRDKATQKRADISQFEGLLKSRLNWIIFFSDLQKSLFDVQDCWLDSLKVERVLPAPPKNQGNSATTTADAAAASSAKPTYTLTVSGRMLLRDISGTEANSRIRNLIKSLTNSPFIKKVQEESLKLDFTTDPRMLGFTFNADIDPDKPL